MHTAPGACSKYASGAACIQKMLLEHIQLRIFFQIINGPGPYGPGAYGWTISQSQNLKKASDAHINV